MKVVGRVESVVTAIPDLKARQYQDNRNGQFPSYGTGRQRGGSVFLEEKKARDK